VRRLFGDGEHRHIVESCPAVFISRLVEAVESPLSRRVKSHCQLFGRPDGGRFPCDGCDVSPRDKFENALVVNLLRSCSLWEIQNSEANDGGIGLVRDGEVTVEFRSNSDGTSYSQAPPV
jgi:hypothetical protein